MLDYNVKIGLITMRRNTTDRPKGAPWNWNSAQKRGWENTAYIREHFACQRVSFADCKGLGIGDLIFDSATAKQAICRMQQENVDAILIINCNFGNEEAAAEIALALGKPVLLWAPLDEEYDENGVRSTDAQCGIFGVARQLQRYHVPFSYIPSCRVDSEEFREGLDRFIRVSCMVKNFKNMRIGQVGPRPTPFYSVVCNEGQLMENFGLRITAINFAVLQQRMQAAPETYGDEIEEVKQIIHQKYQVDEGSFSKLTQMATLSVVFKHLFLEFDLDVMVSECWTAIPQMFDGLMPCACFGILNDMGYMVACESDIHGAMTMALLKSATLGEGVPLFGEFTVRHPENKNAELLWHCGPFPASQAAKGETARVVDQKVWMRAKDGVYTVARLDQEQGKYMILPVLCKTTTGPKTNGSYIWAEFEDLPKVEKRVVEGPYIHHFAEILGDYRNEIAEFCKYIPGLHMDEV